MSRKHTLTRFKKDHNVYLYNFAANVIFNNNNNNNNNLTVELS